MNKDRPKGKPRPEAYGTLEHPPVQGADTCEGSVIAYFEGLKEWHEVGIQAVLNEPFSYPLWSPTPRVWRPGQSSFAELTKELEEARATIAKQATHMNKMEDKSCSG